MMNPSQPRLLLAALLAAGLAAPARAQHDDPQSPRPDPQAGPARTVHDQQQQGSSAIDLSRGSALLGVPVEDQDGQPVGFIADIVVDENDGSIVAALLECDGARDKGSHATDPAGRTSGAGAMGGSSGAGAAAAGGAGDDDEPEDRYGPIDDDGGDGGPASGSGPAGGSSSASDEAAREAAARSNARAGASGAVVELVPLPFSLLEPAADTPLQDGVATPQCLRLTVGRDKLRDAPRISVQRPLDGDQLVAVYEFFAVPAVWMTNPNLRQGQRGEMPPRGQTSGAPPHTAQGGQGAMPPQDDPTMPPHAMRVVVVDSGLALLSELVDVQVAGNEGERLGQIEDVAVSWKNRDVAYAVLERQDGSGLGGQRFAVPWNALDRQGGRITLDVNASALEQATGFSEWPREPDSDLFEEAGSSPAAGEGG